MLTWLPSGPGTTSLKRSTTAVKGASILETATNAILRPWPGLSLFTQTPSESCTSPDRCPARLTSRPCSSVCSGGGGGSSNGDPPSSSAAPMCRYARLRTSYKMPVFGFPVFPRVHLRLFSALCNLFYPKCVGFWARFQRADRTSSAPALCCRPSWCWARRCAFFARSCPL